MLSSDCVRERCKINRKLIKQDTISRSKQDLFRELKIYFVLITYVFTLFYTYNASGLPVPIKIFMIQTVVTQHHLIRRYASVTFAAFVTCLELGPPVLFLAYFRGKKDVQFLF